MKTALQKSAIPKTHAFVVHALEQPNFDPNLHFHSEFQIFLVLKGNGTRMIGDSVKPFKEGDLVFIGPNLPHLWRSDTEGLNVEKKSWSKGIVIYFHDDFVSKSLLEKEELIKLKQLFRKSLRGIEITGNTAKIIKGMMIGLLKIEGFESVLELLKILNFLSLSEKLKLLASSGYTNSLKEGDTIRMNKVQDYVMGNFRQKISIREVASIANLTPTSFSRYFKIHANKTFSEFLSEIRIGNACKLLIDEQMDIRHTCYESGFQTISNFNRQFKKITQRTPTAYKLEYGMK